ncbi:MAG: hypothetical protein KDA44_18965 [Planctomycetales bacterium]|nr:hypothetical protein [Planctomycetales bacterium]
MSIPAPPPRAWQAELLTLWPQIERQTEFAVQKLRPGERDEARQSIFASVAVAYAELAAQGRAALAFPGPLVAYGLRHYQAGRLIGGRVNSRDVGSRRWRHVSGQRFASLADCQETLALADQRRATPAEIACLRIDFAAWLGTLSVRDRQLTRQLARGEETRQVAARFRLSAGRVSQLRRELYDSWQRFCGEPTPTPA